MSAHDATRNRVLRNIRLVHALFSVDRGAGLDSILYSYEILAVAARFNPPVERR